VAAAISGKEARSFLASPSEGVLRRVLNAVKREQFPWMFEATKCAPQEAIRDLGAAFENFFEGCALRKVGFRGRPDTRGSRKKASMTPSRS